MNFREMMRAPQYWRDHDPEYVKRIENGFKKLYGEKFKINTPKV